MFSVSPAEIVTILVVALIVFGPTRLPEVSRRAGKILGELKTSAQELRDGIEREMSLPDDQLGRARRNLPTPPEDESERE